MAFDFLEELASTQLPDQETLDYLFAKTKTKLLTRKRKGFLGSLLCNHNFIWDESCLTAWCNGETIAFNPRFFIWLTPEERVTVLAHELWHSGYGHMARRSNRCPDYWNYACDYIVNNMLDTDGFVFGEKLKAMGLYLDHQYDNMTTEQVYDLIFPNVGGGGGQGDPNQSPQGGSSGASSPNTPQSPMKDVVYEQVEAGGDKAKQDVQRKILQGRDTAQKMNEAGDLPGEITEILSEFLDPILPWEVLLQRFMSELSKDDYSWKRPSRRFEDDYLPSLAGGNGLEHLIYYVDVSGSITTKQMLRFHSEVKFIHESLQPKRLTLATFDKKIQDVLELTNEMPFDKVEVHGRGGTSLDPVRRHIKENHPTAVVIFSDLCCHPMTEDPQIPVIWVVIGNKKAVTHFGKVIHIPDEK